MLDTTLTIRKDGIHHGLPVLPTSGGLSGHHAIVIGASGMSGQSMVDVLAKDSNRWKKVYALSRRPPQLDAGNTNVEHVAVDFLKQPDEVAAILQKVGVRA